MAIQLDSGSTAEYVKMIIKKKLAPTTCEKKIIEMRIWALIN